MQSYAPRPNRARTAAIRVEIGCNHAYADTAHAPTKDRHAETTTFGPRRPVGRAHDHRRRLEVGRTGPPCDDARSAAPDPGLRGARARARRGRPRARPR